MVRGFRKPRMPKRCMPTTPILRLRMSNGGIVEDAASRSVTAKTPSGYVPSVKSMEDKLRDERKPVQKLLLSRGLCPGRPDRSADREANDPLEMTGKTSQDAERDIVEDLRQLLQLQVKSFIRKARVALGDPRTQEDLRKRHPCGQQCAQRGDVVASGG